MKSKFFRIASISFLLAISSLSNVVHAGVIFYDDFDDGSLMNNPLYAKNDHGIIVNDPLEGDYALSFNGTDGGSDLDSVLLTSNTGTVFLSFDYLGTCNNLAGGCGGYFNLPQSGKRWIGTSSAYNDWGFNLTDDNTWQHYEVSFAAISFTFTLEDWGGVGSNIAGDAYFDNIRFSDEGFATANTIVPEPSTLAIFALAMMGFRARRLKKNS